MRNVGTGKKLFIAVADGINFQNIVDIFPLNDIKTIIYSKMMQVR